MKLIFVKDIKTLSTSLGGILLTNIPTMIVDYANAAQVVISVGFSLATGILTLLYTYKRYKSLKDE